MISVYGETRGPRRPDVPDYPDIPVHRELPGHLGLPDHPEYPEPPEPPGHIHRYWMAGLEILDERLMNTAWQANR